MAVGDGRFWLVRLVDQKIVVGISNWFYVVFGPSLAPIPNFVQIGWKTQKLKIVIIGRVWLVGLVGKKRVVGISNSLCCFWDFISPHTKFHQNPMENAEVENFHYWSVLVGRAGRLKNGCRHSKLILCCFWSNICPHAKFHQNWNLF